MIQKDLTDNRRLLRMFRPQWFPRRMNENVLFSPFSSVNGQHLCKLTFQTFAKQSKINK